MNSTGASPRWPARCSRRGVGFGDRVLILMLNRTEFIESFLAVNKLGAIAVPVNFRMTPPEIAFLVSDCEAQVVITESVLAKRGDRGRATLDADAGRR